MGIREKLNENPMISGGITVGVIVIALGWSLWYGFGCGGPKMGPVYTQAWYTTVQDKPTFTKADEGKLFFADKATKFAPFMKDGKEAVRVYLFTCDNGKTMNVAFLEKYTKEAQAVLEKAQGQPGNAEVMEAAIRGRLVKKPGKEWVNREDGGMIAEDMEQPAPCPPGVELKPHFPPK